MTTVFRLESIDGGSRVAVRLFISCRNLLQENSFDVRDIVTDPCYSRVFEVNKAE